MRVISMVPSWTETLLNAGVNVVGRTRFCIHPGDRVQGIPVVGGTKEINWDLVTELQPDLVILDKEENPLEMAEECPVPYFATHVESLESLAKELKRLGERLQNIELLQWSERCHRVIMAKSPNWDFQKVPGFMDSVKAPTKNYATVAYLIWKKPWMSVSRETYIGSVLERLGAQLKVFSEPDRYPVVELEELQDSFLLFSSEPFPFHKKIDELRELGLEGVIVDGESYSWFGVRSIRFLETYLGIVDRH